MNRREKLESYAPVASFNVDQISITMDQRLIPDLLNLRFS